MFERRHLWYALAVFALLLAPFAMAARPAQAADFVYVVNSQADSGGACGNPCTLRQAILAANADTGSSEIRFLFTGSGNVTIAPSSALPPIIGVDTIFTGLLNAGFQPRIIIDGSSGIDGPLAYGFSISATADRTEITNLIFTGFRGQGSAPFGAAIYVNGADNVKARGNYIGNIPATAYNASQANRIGVLVSGGSGTMIGGSQDTDRNTISGNTVDGVVISAADSTVVLNNYVGVVLDNITFSTKPLGNGVNGVQVESSTNATIGGTKPNTISANGANGILVTGSTAITNTISYNFIGTDESGATHGGLGFGNGADGVRVENEAKGTILSGAGAASPTLLISNNAGYGVRVTTGAWATRVSGAIIGLDSIGARFDNQLGGVALLNDSASTTVGPNNYISGNAGAGVVLKLTSGSYTAVSDTTITGNFIGLDTARTGKVANTGPGIDVQAGSTDTRIGATGAGNYIAGNVDEGVKISGTGTISTTVENNVIGLVNTLANGSGTYTVSQGNEDNGILVSGGATNTTISANLIAGHTAAAGISLSGVTTATLSLNDIGYVTGVTPAGRPNATGISLSNVVAVDVLTNTVRYNSGSGIVATDVQTVTLRSNTVADQPAGDGITINGGSSRVKVISNTLTTNIGYGVQVAGSAQQVTIQYNKMKLNTLGGVLLAGTTKGLITESDTATSPNHGIDPPIYDPANDPTFVSPLRFMVDQFGNFEGYVYTDTLRTSSCRSSAEGACQIQFFAPASDDTVGGQGFTPYQVKPTISSPPVDFVSTDAEGSGRFSGQLVLNGAQLPKQLIFAATDGLGNSSEFGVLTVDLKIRVAYVDTPNGQQNARPGETITYTLSLVNEGTIRLSDVRGLTSNSLSRWTVNPPNGYQTPLVIDDHRSVPFTVTMTLPKGTDLNVRADTQDRTSLFALVSDNIQTLTPSKIMTTTVLATPVISAESPTKWGSAPPTRTVTHTHSFANSGNVTVTMDLGVETIDPAASGYVWSTALSASSLEIPPDQSRSVNVIVTVPNGAPTVNALGQPFIVTTVLTGTGRSPYNTISSVVSGTVGVDLAPSVRMGGSEWMEDAASFAAVSFNHSVTNTSNGPATFCLNWRSNSGSSVLSFTSQNDVAIDKNRCFRLDMSTGAKSILRFDALIQVTGKLLPQEVDRVEIFLTDTNGQRIANSTVFDNIKITVSPLLPRIWLPIVNTLRSL